jgi:hypothetical protein
MHRPSLEILEFSEEFVFENLGKSDAAKYLYEYLTAINAKSIIFEKHYVDRHYLDDFVHYYSKSFDAPVSYCQRLHFFSKDFDQLSMSLNDACKSVQERKRIEQDLCCDYLGFVVIRPLVSAKVGRTVLRTYPSNNLRKYTVTRSYRVHLAGLKLSVDGLAYQEQDQCTAVCASIALWSALQRVSFVSGHRTPTPSAITKAAKSPLSASSGLNDYQMAEALNSLGYLADLFFPTENRHQFRAKIVACLESHLPVILLLSQKQHTGNGEVTVGHAVTVNGFQKSQNIINIPASTPTIDPLKMKSGSLDVIYVHDDNLGPHAHYELYDVDEQDTEGYKVLKVRRGCKDQKISTWWNVDDWTVYAALVPKNQKMRLPIEHLFTNLLGIRNLIEKIIFEEYDLNYSVRFSSGVEYKRSLFDLSFDPKELYQFLSDLTLPRYVEIVEVNNEEIHLCDVILDISEFNQGYSGVLGFVAPGVPRNSEGWKRLNRVVQYLEIPLLVAVPKIE